MLIAAVNCRFAFPADKVDTVIAFLHASKWKLRVCKNLFKFSELGSGEVWIKTHWPHAHGAHLASGADKTPQPTPASSWSVRL